MFFCAPGDTDKKIISTFKALMEKEANYVQGDLLCLTSPLLLGYEKIKDLVEGSPRDTLDIKNLNRIQDGHPFMFINWAVYDNNMNLAWHDLSATDTTPRFFFGMNILIMDKIKLLSCGLPQAHYPPLRFLQQVLPRLKKL